MFTDYVRLKSLSVLIMRDKVFLFMLSNHCKLMILIFSICAACQKPIQRTSRSSNIFEYKILSIIARWSWLKQSKFLLLIVIKFKFRWNGWPFPEWLLPPSEVVVTPPSPLYRLATMVLHGVMMLIVQDTSGRRRLICVYSHGFVSGNQIFEWISFNPSKRSWVSINL